MNNNNNIKLALLIGLFAGAIFTVTNQLQIALLNCCLCLVIFLPGFLAVYLSIRDEVKTGNTQRLKLSQGAVVGLTAGLSTGLTNSALSLLYSLVFGGKGGRAALEQAFKEAIERAQDNQAREMITRISQYVLDHYVLMMLVFAVFGIILHVIFSGLGGMLAAGLFDERQAAAAPATPAAPTPDGYSYRGYQPPAAPTTNSEAPANSQSLNSESGNVLESNPQDQSARSNSPDQP